MLAISQLFLKYSVPRDRYVSNTSPSERLDHRAALRSISYRILHLWSSIHPLTITVSNSQELSTKDNAAIITVLKVITSFRITAMIVLLLLWYDLILRLCAIGHASPDLFHLRWVVEGSRTVLLIWDVAHLTKKVTILNLILTRMHYLEVLN